MHDPDDESDDEEVAEEDVLALQAIAALLEVDGDDELAQAHREALAAVADEAMALKARREKRERQEAAEHRARLRERREKEVRARRQDERAARDKAERVEASRRMQTAREAAEDRARERARAERRERERREEETRRQARHLRRVEERQAVASRGSPAPVAPRPAQRVQRPATPAVVERPGVARPKVAGADDHADNHATPAIPVKEPALGLHTEQASLTGADLATWRSRLGLTQQAAADRLGVRQGTVSKAEGKPRAALGPALKGGLAGALRSDARTA